MVAIDMKMRDEHVKIMHRKIFAWYKKAGRHDLPWRATDDIYHVAVAEIMLQQTNVPKVIDKFCEFIRVFPSIEKLAKAQQKEVVLMWQGLGYNRRALYVHRMAQLIVDHHQGQFPENAESLKELPGIGPYTSRSILIFARNHNIATYDVNIVRIFRRILGINNIDMQQMDILVADALPQKRSRDWHNALMDFASLICTKRSPRCAFCPINMICNSFPCPDDQVIHKRKEIGRSEKGKHVPRRIYRGRIIELLRQGNYAEDEIGQKVKKDWHEREDQAWCHEILLRLQEEGLTSCKKGLWMLR